MEDHEIKNLIQNFRSNDEKDKNKAISQIPRLLSLCQQTSNTVLDQLILVIYNLATSNPEKHERLNARNRDTIFKHLLRLYAESPCQNQYNDDDDDHNGSEQLNFLSNLIKYSESSELLVEVAHVLYRYLEVGTSDKTSELVHQALQTIFEKATINLQPEVLLMIHSIWAALEQKEKHVATKANGAQQL